MNKSHSKPIHKSGRFADFMQTLEKSSDFPAIYILSSLSVAFTLIFFGIMEVSITNLVGILFPIYWTFKSFESYEKDDEKHWVCYWAIFGILLVSDFFLENLLTKIPLFYTLKTLFLVWMFLPNFKGSLVIYKNIVEKYFGKIEFSERFQNWSNNVQKRIQEKLSKTSHKNVSNAYSTDSHVYRRINSEGNYDDSLLSKEAVKTIQHSKSQVADSNINTSEILNKMKDKISKKSEAYKEKIKQFSENKENMSQNNNFQKNSKKDLTKAN